VPWPTMLMSLFMWITTPPLNASFCSPFYPGVWESRRPSVNRLFVESLVTESPNYCGYLFSGRRRETPHVGLSRHGCDLWRLGTIFRCVRKSLSEEKRFAQASPYRRDAKHEHRLLT
jgi:hypothetical protein